MFTQMGYDYLHLLPSPHPLSIFLFLCICKLAKYGHHFSYSFLFFSPHTKILFVRVVFTFSIFHLVCHSDDIWDIWEVNAVQQIIVQVCRSVRKQNGSQELHSDLALVTFFTLHLPVSTSPIY